MYPDPTLAAIRPGYAVFIARNAASGGQGSAARRVFFLATKPVFVPWLATNYRHRGRIWSEHEASACHANDHARDDRSRGLRCCISLMDTMREARRLGIPYGKIADPIGAGVERFMAVFQYAETQHRARDFCLNACRWHLV